MRTVNLVSGGKSSAYMAVHYPADFNLFCVVLTEDPNCRIKDPGLRREAIKKLPILEEYGSKELDNTLLCMLHLEQVYGVSLDWTSSEYTYEQLCRRQTHHPGFRSNHGMILPSRYRRICTTYLKIYPTFNYIYTRYMRSKEDIMIHNLGFRADEPKRVERLENCKEDALKVAFTCSISGKHRWTSYSHRIASFPMYFDGIDAFDVAKFWSGQILFPFPKLSNCDFCFFHRKGEHQAQYELYPERIQSWIDLENQSGHPFHKKPIPEWLDDFQVESGEEDGGCYCSD